MFSNKSHLAVCQDSSPTRQNCHAVKCIGWVAETLDLTRLFSGVERLQSQVVSEFRHSGQAAPPLIHVRIALAVSSRDKGGRDLPSPGFHPQPTKSSCATWLKSCSRDRPPFCFGSFSCRQRAAGERPTKTILCSGTGRLHFGFPGGMCAPGKLRS